MLCMELLPETSWTFQFWLMIGYGLLTVLLFLHNRQVHKSVGERYVDLQYVQPVWIFLPLVKVVMAASTLYQMTFCYSAGSLGITAVRYMALA